MRNKAKDLLFAGFICQFIFAAIGGIFGWIVNWIIFGAFAYYEWDLYETSIPGLRKHLAEGTLQYNENIKRKCKEWETEKDIQVKTAVACIIDRVEKGDKRYANAKGNVHALAGLLGTLVSDGLNKKDSDMYYIKVVDDKINLIRRKRVKDELGRIHYVDDATWS